MKTLKSNDLLRTFIGIILLAMMVFIFSFCARKIIFMSSAIVPNAYGSVHVKKDFNNNYAVKLEINDLTELDKLNIINYFYIVWIETGNGNTVNLGQLKKSFGLLLPQQITSFETVTSRKPTKVFITAEKGLNYRNPGLNLVLSTRNF